LNYTRNENVILRQLFVNE